MALIETPQDWSSEFLRSEKFNKEIRDKQEFLFKRPRTQITLANAGTYSPASAFGFIDENGFVAEIETTGRPLLVTIQGELVRSNAAVSQHSAHFDIKVGYGYASNRGGVNQLARGCWSMLLMEANQRKSFCAHFIIDWLAGAGIYTIKPMWIGTTSLTINTAQQPLDLLVEEI